MRLATTFATPFIALATALAQAQEILPADPVEGETVLFTTTLCRGGSPTWVASTSSRIEGGKLFFEVDFDGADFAVGSCARAFVASPPLPAGRIDVVYSAAMDLPAPPAVLQTLDVAANSDVAPLYRGLSGNWFEPASSGTGVNFVQGRSGKLFAAWLTYGLTYSYPSVPGEAFWLVNPDGRWITPTRWRGLLYSTVGRGANVAWDPQGVGIYPCGYLTLDFESADQVVFEAEMVPDWQPAFKVKRTLRRFLF